MSRKRNKILPNDACPCGSGQKYKRCCGRSSTIGFESSAEPTTEELRQRMAILRAEQMQRQKQQGLGKPIISSFFKGYRFVVVGEKVYYSKNWKTFHDFLLSYIEKIFGNEWGNTQLKKSKSDQHPLIQWRCSLTEIQQQNRLSHKLVKSTVMTGAIFAYLGFAYNLYLLGHNVGIQSLLVNRLKDKDKFLGPTMKPLLPLSFIKAGFKLELENESDGSTSHCEFTATYKPTGKKFSVEAKSRRVGKDNFDVGNQLYDALKKKANYARIIFIEMNVPDADIATGIAEIEFLNQSLESMRSREEKLTISGEPAPAAYVFITNQPYHYCLNDREFRSVLLVEGFKMPDFKPDKINSLRGAINTREQHREIFELMRSIRDIQEIPSTFDGQIPTFAFDQTINRLVIGNKYLVPDETGRESRGIL